MTTPPAINLDAFVMPFTANRQFKAAPRLLARAAGVHYITDDGRQILDGTSGLWCVNAGHARHKIVDAIAKQAAKLDFAPVYQMGHPKAFEAATKLTDVAPDGFDHVFFTNSGSEAVESALKLAIAYHRARGNTAKTRFIGRERGFHGTNFGGTAVGGIPANRDGFARLGPPADHMAHTHDLTRNAFSRGQPEHGSDRADDLERLITKHGADTIAAVIVEPVAGSTGVLIPPKGYLERLATIAAANDILLIFDEVITGFGRLGAPFASEHFGVSPDLITTAKGMTNGAVPMGSVLMKTPVHDALMQGPAEAIDLFHGYTYAGHPLAAAACLATLETYEDEGLLTRAATLAKHWEERIHALRDLPHVIDIRNIGLVGAIEFAPIEDAPTKRAYTRFVTCFERGLLVRQTGDTLALSPPLIITPDQIDQLFDILEDCLRTTRDA